MNKLRRLFKCGTGDRTAFLCMVVLCVTTLLNAVPTYAQTHQVKGTILDENKQPIIGATIVVDGTTVGVTSDVYGRFTISVPPKNENIKISYIGYDTKVVNVSNKSNITIALNNSNKVIDEVVIVAFGQQKKVSVTGAVSSVNNIDLKKSPVSNFSTALSGRLPGLIIQQGSGQPGQEYMNIHLRGLGTTGNARPLIMIDGVPRDDLASIDSNEVEDVTVLKDAASTAVFGVRGANGVILVTTRRGAEGKAEVSITAEQSFQHLIYRGSVQVDSWDYAKLINLRNENDGLAPAFNDWQIEQYRSGADPTFFPNRDPYKEMTKSAPQTKVNVNVTGGTKNIQYFINASYLHQGSIFKTQSPDDLGYDPGFSLDRLNLRANVDYKVSKHLKASINLSGYLNTNNLIPWEDGMEWRDPNFDHPWVSLTVIGGLNRTPPTNPGPTVPAGQVDNLGNAVPEGGWIKEMYQYYPRMNYAGYIRQTRSTMNTSAALAWDMGYITKGLSSKVMLSYDLNAMGWIKASRWFNAYTYYLAKSAEEKSYFYQTEFNGATHSESALWFYPNGGRGQSSGYKFNGQVSINYDRLFKDKHDIHAMVLGQRDNWVSNNAVSLFLPYNMLYLSGRATYTFDKRYTAEVNIGYNGSEQFAKGKRFGVFPAFSAGWVISEEPFFKSIIKPKWIDYLKLRASYGIVGNDQINDVRFLYLDNMRLMDNGPISSLGRGQYVSTGEVGNPDLTWERSKKQNYGIDINFLKDFSFNADYFREYRDNILITRQTVPNVQGITSANLPKANMGIVENNGYELVLSYNKMFNQDWSFRASANYCFARNKILAADEVKRPTGKRNYLSEYKTTGYSIGQIWGLQVDYEDGAKNGFINNEADLKKYNKMYQSGGFIPDGFLGDWKFNDANKDGKIDDKDVVPLGYSGIAPEITYGGSIAVSYKSFDLSVLLQGVAHKNHFFLVGTMDGGHVTGDWELHSWTKERFENNDPIKYRALTNRALSPNEWNDYVLSNLSYMRIKNVEIGYSLPLKFVQRLGLKGLRIAVSGQNLFTINNMKAKTMDPEEYNANAYPITRNINFSLNIRL